MKNLLCLFLTLICFTSFSQVPNYVPSNGLIGWWAFDGNALDSSPNTFDGLEYDLLGTSDRFGVTNKALLFNGTSSYVKIPQVFDYSQRTISCWFNSTDNSGNGLNGKKIINIDANTLVNGLVVLRIDDGILGIWAGGESVNYSVAASENQWYHVVMIRDLGSVKYYFNGVNVGTGISGTLTSATNPNPNMVIGVDRSEIVQFFTGKIDDVGLWNRALTDCEVQDLYNAQLSSISSDVTISGNTLTAEISGGSYQWLDCDNGNAEIPGATSQSFTPSTVTGNYAVQIELNGCTDTSACFYMDLTGIKLLSNDPDEVLIKITDPAGKEIPYQKNTLMLLVYSSGRVSRVIDFE